MSRLDNATTDGSSRPAPDVTGPGPALLAPARLRVRPTHVATAAAFGAAAWIATSPVNDLDSYWHVEIGREIVARHTLDGLGVAWLGVPAGAWRSSQWLSEVLMYGAVDHFGWNALVALRLLTAAALFAVLALTLVRGRQPVASFLVVLAVVVGTEVLLQDRPATVSLVFVALLGAACERLWVTGLPPPPALVAVACLVWAQLHGLWVLAPAAFVVVALGALLDRRRATPGQLRGALVCAAASLAGLVNPQGAGSFLLPVRFQEAAGTHIVEWSPTTFTSTLSISLGFLVIFLIVAWVRSPVRIPNSELLWSLVWTIFGLTAVRNVGPAILLTAPVVLRALERSLGAGLDRFSARPSRAMSRLLAGALVAVLVVCVAACTVAVARTDPLRRTPGLAIARRLAADPGPIRVWNAYNVSGALIAFAGGREGHVRLVVDGRSDLWGGAYIDRNSGVLNLADDWGPGFDGFRPDAAVLPLGTPLLGYLLAVRHWRVALQDRAYALLVPPGSSL